METRNKKEDVLEKIDDLKGRETSLSSDIAKLQTEEGQEEIIRSKYQLAKPGEKVVTIVNEDANENTSPEVKVSHGFWNWVKNLFK